MSKPQPRALLRDLAGDRLPRSHDAFGQLPNWRTAAYLRDLLMQRGALPTVDRQVLLFKRWLVEYLAAAVDPKHSRVLHHRVILGPAEVRGYLSGLVISSDTVP